MIRSKWQRGLCALAGATVLATGTSQAQAILNVGAMQFDLIGRYETGQFFNNSIGAAEIVAHDPGSQRLFVVNGINKTIDVIDFADPTTPTFFTAIDLNAFFPGSSANSVAVKNGIVAIAAEASIKQNDGQVIFFNANDANFNTSIKQITVGALPDMITFTPDGTKVLVANEGEPNSYNQGNSVDPLGSVSIIDVSTGAANAALQHQVTFSSFDGQKAALLAAGIRIYGPNATVGQDIEPEYITVSPDGTKAFVTLQENNAVAIIDIATGNVDKLAALGYKNHNLAGNGLDLSDQDGPGTDPAVSIVNAPVFGMYQPDGIAAYTVNGNTFFITANEGDAREYTGFAEENRISAGAISLTDPLLTPLKSSNDTSRLTVTNAYGKTLADGGGTDNDPDFDRLYALGARSFSIWDDQGNLIFDSGDDIEQLLKNILPPNTQNSTHDSAPSFDTRSDNKGPEPESVAIALLDDRFVAFIGLERDSGILAYDVTNPNSPSFLGYVNTRDFSKAYSAALITATPSLLGELGDLGPEGLIFINAADSPNGRALFLTANEVSGTVAIFQVSIVPEPATGMLALGSIAALAMRRRRA